MVVMNIDITEVMIMNNYPISLTSWNYINEDYGNTSQASGSFLLLLVALEKGWQVKKVEMVPSWDQHGFIYIITLHHSTTNHSQQFILPKNDQVENLLQEVNRTPSRCCQSNSVGINFQLI